MTIEVQNEHSVKIDKSNCNVHINLSFRAKERYVKSKSKKLRKQSFEYIEYFPKENAIKIFGISTTVLMYLNEEVLDVLSERIRQKKYVYIHSEKD